MSLKHRAAGGDTAAQAMIIEPHLPPGETVSRIDYLGTRGMFSIGTMSFAAVTDRRIVGVELGLLGQARVVTGYHESINGTVLYQSSRALFYLAALLYAIMSVAMTIGAAETHALLAVVVAVVAMLLAPVANRLYYRFAKSGVSFVVAEGVPILLFADRMKMGHALEVQRSTIQQRELRLSALGRVWTSGRASAPHEPFVSHPGPAPTPAPTPEPAAPGPNSTSNRRTSQPIAHPASPVAASGNNPPPIR